MEAIFHSHSFIEIETQAWSLLIDPFVSRNSFCDINLWDILQKNILAILITNWKPRYIQGALDIAKNANCLLISTFEIVEYLKNFHNLQNTHALHIWWSFDFSFWVVKLINTIHGEWIWPDSLWWNSCDFLLNINWKKIYHAWDSLLTHDMGLLESENIDLAFLPIWDNFRTWMQDSIKAAKSIKSKFIVPMYCSDIKQDVQEFAQKIMLDNISICKVLSPWQSFVFAI